ncbi:SDR family oxidoreductase [Shimia sp. NS0008-38b]|uniref:SDR family oxidoreductase n=1 Tax=Shimia sp. NS0008-38b TaxID=3127653 RepID=UPI0031049C79
MTPDLTGKTAIITGASRGIGEATARHFASLGANVALLARNRSALENIAKDIGHRAIALPCDVAQWNDTKLAVAKSKEIFGSIDILVNNAGTIDPIAHIADVNPFEWGQAVDINLKGAFYMLRATAPEMCAQGAGVVINISSGAASSALEGWSHYCATKAALLSLTRTAHKELGPKGINVVGLSPGTVATDMQRSIRSSGLNPVSQLAWESHIPAAWVAQAIAWLTTDDARTFDGTDFSLKTENGRDTVGLPTT